MMDVQAWRDELSKTLLERFKSDDRDQQRILTDSTKLYTPCSSTVAEMILKDFLEKENLGVREYFVDKENSGMLNWEPVLFEDDVVPMLCILPGAYLSWFRGYRMQISATPTGIGDCGSSQSTMRADYIALQHDHHMYSSIMLAHCAQIPLLRFSTESKRLAKTILENQVDMERFILATAAAMEKSCPMTYFGIEEHMPKYQIMDITDDVWEFPVLTSNPKAKNVPEFLGHFILGYKILAYMGANSSVPMIYHFKDEEWTVPFIRMRLYLLAFKCGLWGGYSEAVCTLEKTTPIPSKFQHFLQEDKFTWYRNIYRIEEFLASSEFKDTL